MCQICNVAFNALISTSPYQTPRSFPSYPSLSPSTSLHLFLSPVTCVSVNETFTISPGFTVRAHYAGHVLGAGMFEVVVGSQRAVYTGDFNMTPDRHLGAARIGRVCPDVLISESTYATTIRDSKRAREQDFLQRVKDCVTKGGKVLIPVFALGRAQELCILLDAYWTRMGLKDVAPIYFGAGLTSRANEYFRMHIGWTNETLKTAFTSKGENRFNFKNITQFERHYSTQPGPMVVFATPGMLHAGLALELFKLWCGGMSNRVNPS